MWQVLKVCVEYDTIVIMQAANTGVTAGSTPMGDDYDREIVIVNTRAMDDRVLLDGGNQVLEDNLEHVRESINAIRDRDEERMAQILAGYARQQCRQVLLAIGTTAATAKPVSPHPLLSNPSS